MRETTRTQRNVRAARGFTLLELMVTVSILGILASVAIPGFMRYIRRAKTVEAAMAVRNIFNGAVAYYNEDHVAAADAMVQLPRQLPTADGTYGSSTCAAGPDGASTVPRTDGDRHMVGFQNSEVVIAGQTAPANAHYACWDALAFGVTDPTYFAFAFEVQQGDGDDAIFIALAYGDLDADGDLSTYARAAEASAGIIHSAGGLFMDMQQE